MTRSIDEDEHSIEMHLPYVHRLLQRQYPDRFPSEYPPLIPIMVGSTSAATERAFGSLLAPYLADPANAFVISSDFCHWGLRFHYTYYVPQAPKPGPVLPLSSDTLPQPGYAAEQSVEAVSAGKFLQRRDRTPGPHEPAIHESISSFDMATMAAITTGSTDVFLRSIQTTGNTVCGRHPIGVMMAALEEISSPDQEEEGKGRFHFVRYERSSDAVDVTDSSVSYVSAFAVM